MESLGLLQLGLILLAMAVVIACIVLPLAVVGTKSLLVNILHETRRTNELLRKANGERTA